MALCHHPLPKAALLSPASGHHLLLSASGDQLLWTPWMRDIVWYLSLWAWLMSLNAMPSRFICLVTNDRTSCFYDWIAVHWLQLTAMYHTFPNGHKSEYWMFSLPSNDNAYGHRCANYSNLIITHLHTYHNITMHPINMKNYTSIKNENKASKIKYINRNSGTPSLTGLLC